MALLLLRGGRRGLEALAQGLDHLAEPVKVEGVEDEVAAEVQEDEEERDVLRHAGREGRGVVHDVCVGRGRCRGDEGVARDAREVHGGPEVLVDAQRLVRTPEETATEEGDEQEDAVDELGERASHVEFVEEPVEVEEGRRELVEDKRGGVEVDERALCGGDG